MPERDRPGLRPTPREIDREKIKRAGFDVRPEILDRIPDDAPIPPSPRATAVDFSVLPPVGKRKQAELAARIVKRGRYTEPEPNLGKPGHRKDND